MHRTVGITSLAMGFVAFTLAGLACGPSEKDVQAMNEAHAQLKPTIDKLAAMYQALPAKGSEKEQLCQGTLPKEGLETLGWHQLEDILEKSEAGAMSRWERLRFTSGPFGQVYSQRTVQYILDNDPAPAGAIGNMRRAAEELTKVRHVAIFRPTNVDEGKVGSRKGNEYSIERNATWEGWVFVFSLADPPELKAAFAAKGTNGQSIHFMKERGKRPPSSLLIGDAAKRVRNGALARLEKPGCPRILTRNEKWQQACAATPADPEACFELGRLYKHGVDLAKDEAKAFQLFDKACSPEQYVPLACSEVGFAYGNGKLGATKDTAKAAPLYKKACDGEVMAACNNLGVLTGKGDGVAKDLPAAVALYTKACDGKYGLACANLASYYERGLGGVAKNPSKAILLRHQACMNGHKKSCK